MAALFEYFGSPETNVDDIFDFCDSKGVSSAKAPPLHVDVILHPETDFLSVVFWMFFLSALFSWILAAPLCARRP